MKKILRNLIYGSACACMFLLFSELGVMDVKTKPLTRLALGAVLGTSSALIISPMIEQKNKSQAVDSLTREALVLLSSANIPTAILVSGVYALPETLVLNLPFLPGVLALWTPLMGASLVVASLSNLIPEDSDEEKKYDSTIKKANLPKEARDAKDSEALPGNLLTAGKQLLKQSKYLEAVSIFTILANQHNPQTIVLQEAYQGMVKAYLSTGEFAKAAQVANKLISTLDKNEISQVRPLAEAYGSLGKAHLEDGKKELAEKELHYSLTLVSLLSDREKARFDTASILQALSKCTES